MDIFKRIPEGIGTQTLEHDIMIWSSSWPNPGTLHKAIRELAFYVLALEHRIAVLEGTEKEGG